MEKVIDLDGERKQREAWEATAEAVLMNGGMLMEEARERSKALAAGGRWKGSDAGEAAQGELRARGWSVAVPEEVEIRLAGRSYQVLENGLE